MFYYKLKKSDFLQEDDLETLHMGYTSFSENTISKQLVAEYFVYIITKYREPRFLEVCTHFFVQIQHKV